MSLLHQQYALGQTAALRKYAGDDPTNTMVDLLGAAHPGAAAIGAGFTSPEGYGLGQAARTGVSSAAGGLLGEQGGAAAGELLARLLKQDPSLLKNIGGHTGKALGGATGAHAGHSWANSSMVSDMHKQQMGG